MEDDSAEKNLDIWGGDGKGGAKAKKRYTTSAIPAVEVELPGCSFNPPFEAHQDSLAQAVADEMCKIYTKELGPKPVPLTVIGEAVAEEDKFFLDAAADGDEDAAKGDGDQDTDALAGQSHQALKKMRLDEAPDSAINEVPATASSMNQQMFWSQWQLLDSILPTGGFAHSYGLEAAMQSRIVNNPEELRLFLIQVLDNIGSLLLPFVYCASKSLDVATWVKLDQLLEATLTNEVGRKASTSQGLALLRVAASVFTEIPSLQDLRTAFLGSTSMSFHHAPIFGLICGLVGFDSEMTQRAYMFVTMRDVISAATRLNLIGPLAASVLQHQVAPDAEKMVQKWRDRDVTEASQTAPLLDALQGCHAYMFSRLFCS